MSGRLTVDTNGQALTDVTAALTTWLAEIAAQDGVVVAAIAHTTASLTVQENADADVQRDLEAALSRLAPQREDYRHGIEGPDDMPGHIKSALTDVSVCLPVVEGRLSLGQWQALYLWEHRDRPRARTVALTFVGS